METKRLLNLPVNFMSNLADAEIAFQNSNKMVVRGREYEVQFESLTNKRTGKEMIAARGLLDGYAIAATPWQDTDDPHLSAVFALRYALENTGRTFFKPEACDIARLTFGGKVENGIITGFSDEESGVVSIARNVSEPFLDGGQIIVEDATINEIPSYRLRKTEFFDLLKVWKFQYSATPGTEVDYIVSKPVWMVV